MSFPEAGPGPSLLAMILYEKFGAHQPLNRLCERYALEGVPIPLSTMADAVGAGCVVLESDASAALRAHVMAAERLHGDDTTVPVLAARQDRYRPMLGLRRATTNPSAEPPRRRRCSTIRATEAASIRRPTWPATSGIFQADAYSGYGKLYAPERQPGPILQAGCWSHARSPFFIFADLEAAARRKVAGRTPARDLTRRRRSGPPHRRPVRDRARPSTDRRRPAQSRTPGR